LGDGLVVPYRQRNVFVGQNPIFRCDELVPWHGAHCGQGARVLDSFSGELLHQTFACLAPLILAGLALGSGRCVQRKDKKNAPTKGVGPSASA
jgi:hypothetical protein